MSTTGSQEVKHLTQASCHDTSYFLQRTHHNNLSYKSSQTLTIIIIGSDNKRKVIALFETTRFLRWKPRMYGRVSSSPISVVYQQTTTTSIASQRCKIDNRVCRYQVNGPQFLTSLLAELTLSLANFVQLLSKFSATGKIGATML